MAAIVVTPTVLRETKQAIESALEQAAAIAHDYLNTHENVAPTVWQGGANTASLGTAGKVAADLANIINGGQRLAHGLGQAASLMEENEIQSAHTLNNFAATGGTVNL